MIKKLTIGCANIGQIYGLSQKRIKEKEINEIFSLCNKKRIKCFDTADGYKNSYNILNKNKYDFKIDTKVSISNKWGDLDYCENHLKKIKKKINFKKIDTLYIHNPKYLLKKNSKKIIKNFNTLKKKNFYDKIGLSIYDFDNLYSDLKTYKFDVIQCPFNIFDQRLANEGHLKNLKKLGVLVNVRSIFLQGLVTNESLKRKKKFKNYRDNIDYYYDFLKSAQIDPLNFCLNFILNFKELNKIIIGINSKKQLNDILNYKKIKFDKFSLFDLSNKKKLIDPRKW